MQQEDYRRYTIQTIENYSTKHKNKLQSLFKEAGIIIDAGQLNVLGIANALDGTGLEVNQQLVCCIENIDEKIRNRSLGIYERWEFTKDYRYSVLFIADHFDELVKSVLEKTTVYDDQTYVQLYDGYECPQCLCENDNIVLLKFNRKFEAIDPFTANELFIRYPVVIALHKNEKIVEIRFDSLNRVFMKKPDDFYAQVVDEALEYIQSEYGQQLLALDMDFLIRKLRGERDKDTNVCLIAQSMKMANGSTADLHVGNNEEYVLPFIGELQNLLIDYASDFEKVPELKAALEQYIYEKEAMSDYPWISLLWKDEIKTRSIQVKITFNYCQKSYHLLLHYANTLVGMEKMNHVVRFISEAKGNPQPNV